MISAAEGRTRRSSAHHRHDFHRKEVDEFADGLPAQLGLDLRRDGLVDAEVFASIYHPGKLLLLAFWRDAEAARTWRPQRPDGARSLRQRQVRIIRGRGMFDRREAPQFYPAVERARRVAAEWAKATRKRSIRRQKNSHAPAAVEQTRRARDALPPRTISTACVTTET